MIKNKVFGFVKYLCIAVIILTSFTFLNVDVMASSLDETQVSTQNKVETLEIGVLKKSGLTAEELKTGLLYDLKEYSEAFIKAEEETGINAIFLSALAATESGWGRYESGINNIYGWTGDGNYGYRDFDTIEDCIYFVADSLKTNYLSPDGCYFNGYTVKDINIHYNGSKKWENLINGIMYDIQFRIDEQKIMEDNMED